ncbi:PspA/IM30 family protein [Aureimonas sp. AU12]|uniref:PspA/IM30 family protein n=1 Tax=Aureimonas sp. AU12 TaxID=1638161 RepID=UPI000783706E|nr:PspA/IM30 family protein [Aureimonas sp. AU12]
MRTAHFDLMMDETARAEIDRTFAAYGRMKDVLDRAGVTRRTDTFQLQRVAYDEIRHATGLPARLVTNGIREYASGSWSKNRLPLDEKLMSFKGVDHVSISTLAGRVVVGCLLSNYRQDEAKVTLSHLVRSEGRYALDVPLSRDMQDTEIEAMQVEALSARVSRLAAGLATLVVESLEGEAPETVAEQAIGEIDRGVAEIRASLSNATAERKRYEMERQRLHAGSTTLETDARRALQGGREDLARVQVGRLEDIEAQIGSLDRLIGGVDGRIEEAELAIRAAEAARRDAAEQVRIARQAQHEAERADPVMIARPKPVAADRVAAALGVVEGMTDLPAGASRSKALGKLEDFGRARRIEDRLATMRSELGGGD